MCLADAAGNYKLHFLKAWLLLQLMKLDIFPSSETDEDWGWNHPMRLFLMAEQLQLLDVSG